MQNQPEAEQEKNDVENTTAIPATTPPLNDAEDSIRENPGNNAPEQDSPDAASEPASTWEEEPSPPPAQEEEADPPASEQAEGGERTGPATEKEDPPPGVTEREAEVNRTAGKEDPQPTTAAVRMQEDAVVVTIRKWKGRTATKQDGLQAAAEIAEALSHGPVTLNTTATATSGGWLTQQYAEGLADGLAQHPGLEGLTVITPGPTATRVLEFMSNLKGIRIRATHGQDQN